MTYCMTSHHLKRCFAEAMGLVEAHDSGTAPALDYHGNFSYLASTSTAWLLIHLSRRERQLMIIEVPYRNALHKIFNTWHECKPSA